MDTKLTHSEQLTYRAYLENNIQYITEIHKKIEKLILQLEKEHLSVKECFARLENEINLLLKVYSHFTSLGGYSYCLKLKALIDTYQKVTNTEIQLSALYYIHSKILELQEEQLKYFPDLTQKKALYDELTPAKKFVEDDILNFTYKWITFKRNAMWFVVLFDSYQLLNTSDISDLKPLSQNYYQATFNNTTITIRDPLRLDEQPSTTVLLINYHNTTYGYFYDTIGRKLGARNNILQRMAKAPDGYSLPLYGRVRLFGDTHIYLKHIDINKSG